MLTSSLDSGLQISLAKKRRERNFKKKSEKPCEEEADAGNDVPQI